MVIMLLHDSVCPTCPRPLTSTRNNRQLNRANGAKNMATHKRTHANNRMVMHWRECEHVHMFTRKTTEYGGMCLVAHSMAHSTNLAVQCTQRPLSGPPESRTKNHCDRFANVATPLPCMPGCGIVLYIPERCRELPQAMKSGGSGNGCLEQRHHSHSQAC